MKSNSTSSTFLTLSGHHWLSAARLRYWSDALALGFVLGYIIIFLQLAIQQHASFNTSGFDLGIYDQLTWNTLHGRFFFYTTTGQPALHFSNHASLNILLLAPFYLIHSGPETLLFLQVTAIGLGGLPLFWLGRDELKSDLAGLCLLLAYLLFPTLEIVTLWDFHPPALSVGFFMFAFYYLVKRRPIPFLIFVILAISGKEHLPLQGAFLGLYAMVRYRAYRLGGLTIALCLIWFFIVMNWLIPAYSVTGDHLFIGYYADLGDKPAEIILTALTRPDLLLANLWQPAKLRYLYDVLTPFAYLPLLGLPVLLIGTPSFAINLLSANAAMHDATGGQYGADIAPWLAWGAFQGLIIVGLVFKRWQPSLRRVAVNGAALSLLAVALVWHVFRGYSPLALDPPHWEITAHDRLAERFIEQIPADASLAAQGKLYPHLSDRTIAYQLPDVNDAEYVFFDVTTGTWPVHPNDIYALAERLLDSGDYGVLDAADGYLLLKRGLPDTAIPDAFYDFARVDTANPAYPLTIQFGDQLRLLGFDVSHQPRRQETSIRLYWQALRPLDRSIRLYPFILDDHDQIIETTEERPLLTQLWFPPRLWQPGEIVVTETMPWPLGDRWSLAVGVLSGSDWPDWSQRLQTRLISAPPQTRRFEANTWVRLATFEQQGRSLVEVFPSVEAVEPAHPIQANFDDQLELRGYDLSPEPPQPGEPLIVTLHWHALQTMSQDYTVFVHLLDASGQIVAQNDQYPSWEVPVPTSTWLAGEDLPDRHTLQLPSGLPPGRYTLQAGAYSWPTLERLPLIENGVVVNDVATLGSLDLE